MCNSTAITVLAGGISVAYGVLDEWHQWFVPRRYAMLTDVALNAAGVALGVWLAWRAGRGAASDEPQRPGG